MTDDEVRRDFAGLAGAMSSLHVLIELGKILAPELEKRKYSSLGLRTGVSRFDERHPTRK